MLTEEARKTLEKQQYGVVGNHSAVKICGWTKNMIREQGGCYKFKFYGIASHKCLQMTTSISCANRCIYCWRDYKAPVSKTWKWDIDEPDFIIDGALKAQKKLLTGFGGNDKANLDLWKESHHPAHVALSLTGEPITYPKFNEICNKFHERGISTFLVTNAQYPDKIKNINIVTQLYISLDAPNQIIAKDVGKPLFTDYWQRLLDSLDEMKKKKSRTAIRMTMIKEMNMQEEYMQGYKELINRADPDFIEIKAYMFIGASRQRLSLVNMPRHHEIVEFSENFLKLLEGYEISSEQKSSRVVLLSKKKYKGKTWIDFKRFFELLKEKPANEIEAMEYSVAGKDIKEATIKETELD